MSEQALDHARDRAPECGRCRAPCSPARAGTGTAWPPMCSWSPGRSRRARSRWSTSQTSSESACSSCRRCSGLFRSEPTRRRSLALRELIRSRRPDVLHTHTAKAGATGRIAALAAGRARPRAVVHTYHGHVLSGYFSRRWERVFRSIERLLAPASGALVAVSDEVRDDLVGFGVAPRGRFTVVPYGFELPAWSAADDEARARLRAELGPERRDVRDRLGGQADRDQAAARPRPHAAGRARPGRRRRARPRRRRRGPAGGRGAGARARRRRTAAASSASSSVIREWYAAVDASLLTSANEGTPVVAIESLAAERPVVATRAGGTATVVLDGESGYLLPVGDVDGLARPARGARARSRAAGATRSDRRRRRPYPLRHRSDGRRARGGLPAPARDEGPPPAQADRRERLGGSPAHSPSRAAGRGHRRALPRSRRARQRRAPLLCPSRRRRRSASQRPLRLGPQPAHGAGRDPRRARRAPRPAAHASRPRRRLRRDRGPGRRGRRTSRPGTTTTVTCSAPSATSTAASPAAPAA